MDLLKSGGVIPVFEDEAVTPYIDIVNGVESANLIAHWPIKELSGTNIDNAEGTAARDATLSGVTLDSADGPFGEERAGLWDGLNDYIDIFTSSFDTAFDGSEMSVSLWFKVSGASVWTDGSYRMMIRIRVSGNNNLLIRKHTNNNRFDFFYRADATTEQQNVGSFTDTGWNHIVITASDADDEVKYYLNGSQTGSTDTGVGSWSGSLDSATCAIGATGTSPSQVWDGYLMYVAIWDKALSAANITTLYNGGPS